MMDPVADAVDPNRLIEGEDPRTPHAEDARHWLTIYGDLLAYKDMVLSRTNEAMASMEPEAADEVSRTDLCILDRERERISGRLEFWRRRMRELGGAAAFDQRTREIQHDGGAVRLSRREAELFAFLLAHPDGRYRPEELAARAWRMPALSAPQVRNYVVRLRRKLHETRAPYDLISDPGVGYSLRRRRAPAAPES